MTSAPVSGVIVLSGDDKPRTLDCALKHLLAQGRTQQETPPIIEMAWVRDVGGPGGVMVRFRTDQRGLLALKKSQRALQRAIDAFEPRSAVMNATVRAAPPSAQFRESVNHQLVFRTDEPRTGDEKHFANRRSFECFCAMLAHQGIDIAQYESVHQSDNKVRHAARLFDYSGRGKAWLLGAIDRAHRASVVVDPSDPGAKRPEDIIDAIRGGASPNALASLHPIDIAYAGGDRCPTFDDFIEECVRQTPDQWSELGEFAAGEGYIAVSIHGNDRPGFFVDCNRLLEFVPTDRRSRRDVIRSCCRGLGQDGFVLAVARGYPDEVDAIQDAFDNAAAEESARFRSVSRKQAFQVESAIFGTAYRTIFDPIEPDVLVKFIDPHTLVKKRAPARTSKRFVMRTNERGGYTVKLARLIGQIAALGDTTINFLDVRVREPDRPKDMDRERDLDPTIVGCAIAIEHLEASTGSIQQYLDEAGE